nr:DNA polymerase III subunit beta [Jiella sp. LLJ827]
MAFLCHRSVFAPLVEAARKAVRRQKIPILNNLLVTVDADRRISVMGTDLNLSITAHGEAEEVGEAGAISVDAQTLEASIKRMPDGPVRITADEQRMTVRGGRASARINVMPADDHPRVAVTEATHSFELGSDVLDRMADRVGYAMSNDEVRYYLNGMFWHEHKDADPSRLVAVATDAKVVSKIHFPLPEGAAGMPPVIVPIQIVREWRLLAGKKGAAVTVSLNDAHITLSTPTLSITSRLVEGDFPDYARLFPRHNPQRATVDIAALKGALERMLIYAPNDENTHRDIRCTFDGGSLQLFTKSEIGDATDELEIEGEADIVIGLSARYLHPTAQAIGSTRAAIALNDPTTPIWIVSEDEPDHEMVIMPLRLKW